MLGRLVFVVAIGTVVSCRESAPVRGAETEAKVVTAAAPSFADDVAFLDARAKTIVLEDPAGGRVALSAQYQGRVMTSAVSPAGQSLGWINRPFIESAKTGTQFDNYGGEDRFWLGPEGGQNGLYFPPGKPFTFDEWQTPHAMQEGTWEVADRQPGLVTFRRTMTVVTWSGTELVVEVERTVRLLPRTDVAAGVGYVGYETSNKIVNRGTKPWTKETGLPSIWILAMFAPAADARVIVPFEKDGPGEIVNDRYFGKVPPERLVVSADKGFLAFTCDGKQRGKIGLSPSRAKSVLGSYSPSQSLLTVVSYSGPVKGAPYVNSMWEQQKEPYAGDVVNSYNDGPPAPGKPPLGGFYEIETSSPGAELAPGRDLVHVHRTLHFVGARPHLDTIAREKLGVALTDLP
ncbi:MAG: hypothetical protein KIT84_22850 [Labilithrix sp.]|nr:hypothetical protein [Labilithrix sp.]MCW5813885.1 hypothetical protein [Labilithrix sp.]